MDLASLRKTLIKMQAHSLSDRQKVELITLYFEPGQKLLFKHLRDQMFELGMPLSKPALSRGLDVLGIAGFTNRARRDEDKRDVMISITPTGCDFLRQVEAV